MRKIILASSSIWRRDILERTGMAFTIEESGYAEDMNAKLTPEELVRTFALAKAHRVAQRHDDAIIIGADTVLVRGNTVLGKPASKQEATDMLRAWSGKSATALTGIAVIDSTTGTTDVRVVETKLYFRAFDEQEIAGYVESGEPLTGAGAFTIMRGGASLVRRIEGDFYNIAGLPLATLVEQLKKFNVRV